MHQYTYVHIQNYVYPYTNMYHRYFADCDGDNARIQEKLLQYHSSAVYGGNKCGLVDASECNSITGIHVTPF
jgi:hypothetical protein